MDRHEHRIVDTKFRQLAPARDDNMWTVREETMANGLDQLLNVQQSALRVREMRQELLASNIANADTPNYKARDLDFSATLKQQVQQSAQPPNGKLAMTTTSPAHQTGKESGALAGAAKFRNDQQGSIDGNDVDVDKERMEFADNGVRYEASVD